MTHSRLSSPRFSRSPSRSSRRSTNSTAAQFVRNLHRILWHLQHDTAEKDAAIGELMYNLYETPLTMSMYSALRDALGSAAKTHRMINRHHVIVTANVDRLIESHNRSRSGSRSVSRSVSRAGSSGSRTALSTASSTTLSTALSTTRARTPRNRGRRNNSTANF